MCMGGAGLCRHSGSCRARCSRENVKCYTLSPEEGLGVYPLGRLGFMPAQCVVSRAQAQPVLSSALQLLQDPPILFMETACTRRCEQLPR